jgi:DNA-binding transcriptional regulator YdaS (Cro superfamily)
VSATTLKLLRAAAEIIGGEDALAERLGIRKRLFSRYMSGRHELPDFLLLQVVDIVLGERLAATAPAKGNGGSEGIPT